MSHYAELKTALCQRETLLLALADLGFTSEKVEVHDVATNLYGYQNDKREQTAEVIIRRKFVGNASNDIGFKMQDGNFTAIISDYDSTRFNQAWLDHLTQRYAYHTTVGQLAQQGFSIVSTTDEQGEIVLTLMR